MGAEWSTLFISTTRGEQKGSRREQTIYIWGTRETKDSKMEAGEKGR